MGSSVTKMKNNTLENEELLVYFGSLEEAKNVTQIAEYFYPGNKNSVRSSISRKKALDQLIENEFIEPKKREGGWVYEADKSKLSDVLFDLLTSEYEEMPSAEIKETDKEKIQDMFTSEGVENFTRLENIKRILGSKLSHTKRKLSTYFKTVFWTVGGARKLAEDIEDVNLLSAENLTINKDAIKTARELFEFADSISPEEFIDMKPLFDVMMENAPYVNVMEVEVVETERTKNIAEKSKFFLKEVLGKDTEFVFTLGEAGTPA